MISLTANRISSAGVGREFMNVVSSLAKSVPNAATLSPNCFTPSTTSLCNVNTRRCAKDLALRAGGGVLLCGGVSALDFVSKLTKGVAHIIDELCCVTRRFGCLSCQVVITRLCRSFEVIELFCGQPRRVVHCSLNRPCCSLCLVDRRLQTSLRRRRCALHPAHNALPVSGHPIHNAVALRLKPH